MRGRSLPWILAAIICFLVIENVAVVVYVAKYGQESKRASERGK